ncbi:aminoglycoside N(3)-acetyltransferase [Candidatus Woesearchaeota archaeon]|nr:aminoglycoside N(3)-acetyltransferase [Candidatus Woesearchaeota archaeon]
MNEILYEYEGKSITKLDFVSSLKKLGVNKGDILFVHSDISVFGKLANFDRTDLFNSILDSLKEVVGEEGTLIMPTFSYSIEKNEIFDINETKSSVGILTEFFRKQENTLRSIQPNHSVSVWGKDKDKFVDVGNDSFDEHSIFGKLFQKGGKILFLGASFQTCTFIHFIEQKYHVPYRFMKEYDAKIKENGDISNKKITFNYKYFFYFTNLEKFEESLTKEGTLIKTNLGSGKLLLVSSQKMFETGIKSLEKDTFFFLKNKPIFFRIFNMLSFPIIKYFSFITKLIDSLYLKISNKKN